MNNFRINHLAVWVSIIVMHAIGFLWYGILFAKQWMAMVGLDDASMQEDSGDFGPWIMNAVAIIASVYFLAWLLARLGATGIHAAGIGFLAAFTIHHLHTMNSNMFAGEPYGLAWITGGYVVVSLTIAGFILGSWVKKSG
ncbi:MAG TPA: DUF1761 domain-containing protein [Cyclobacteriaceae bacterium]|jgi:hypothetical protein